MVTSRRQFELETFFLVTMAAAVSLFFVYKSNYQQQFSIVSGVPSMSVPAEVVAPKITISSQISPDGTKKVIMKETQNSDDTSTYDFSTSDGNSLNEQFVFTKTLNSPGNMLIPYNTWSPDNKYFFIQENSGVSKKIFVFEATVKSFAQGETYLDVTDSFGKQNTGNSFDEATGWASETLIIINTKKPDGEKGFSYWFEVPSKAIIQLATDF